MPNFYSFNGEVYLVNGIAKSCIYDIERNRLYSIGRSAANVIENLLTNGDKDVNPLVLNQLLENNIIIPSEAPMEKLPDIMELFKDQKRSIKFSWIEVTNICNLKCQHCYNDSNRTKITSMTFDEFKYVCDELSSFGVSEIQLIGGEPFTIPEPILFEMLKYAYSKFESIELFMNGTMVSRKQLEWMKTHVPGIRVALSLHSFIEEEQDKFTQVPGSFKKITQTLNNLKELEFTYRYVGVYTSMIEYGVESDFGVSYKRDYVRLAGRGSLCHYDCNLLKERFKTKDSFKFNNLRESLLDIWLSSCFAKFFYIASDLTIYPCVMERRFSHGNLRNKKLSEIINQELLNFSKENVKGCCDCEYRYLCLDCRPDSLSGDKYEKTWFCLYDEQSGKWSNPDSRIGELLKIEDIKR